MWALNKPFWMINLFNWKSSHNHWRCLKVNSLMLDSHENYPKITVPVDLILLALLYYLDDHIFDLISEGFGILKRRPVIMGLIEIVPVHLIDSYSKHSFIWLIDSFLDESLINEFVGKECSSVSVVEDKGMSQRFGLFVQRSLVFNDCKEFFVKLISTEEIWKELFFQVRVLNSTVDGFGGEDRI